MRSNYKKIGDHIRLIDKRNKGLRVKQLLGLSISKQFIPSVANIIGTDMENYKIIQRNQFACSTMQVRRDKKMPVALLQDIDEAIISQAYPVFEVRDEKKLSPEYLMMWFTRLEFDRESCFHAVGGVRGSLEWEDFCDMQLPIPAIEKQREIVAEYNTIQNRIKLNEQLIQKLEETAQAIYKQWFVEFEFPNEEGKPYKSSGGEMIVSEIGDIPIGWEARQISSLCQITSSKRIFESEYKQEGVPFYRAGEIKQKKEGIPIKQPLYISEDKFVKISKSYGHPLEGEILLTAVGSLLGDSYLVENETFYFKDGNVIWFRNFAVEGSNLYLYEYLQSKFFTEFLDEIKIGSGQSAITIQSLNDKLIIIPSDIILKKYNRVSFSVNKNISLYKKQNSKLYELKDLLLSKLATY